MRKGVQIWFFISQLTCWNVFGSTNSNDIEWKQHNIPEYCTLNVPAQVIDPTRHRDTKTTWVQMGPSYGTGPRICANLDVHLSVAVKVALETGCCSMEVAHAAVEMKINIVSIVWGCYALHW